MMMMIFFNVPINKHLQRQGFPWQACSVDITSQSVHQARRHVTLRDLWCQIQIDSVGEWFNVGYSDRKWCRVSCEWIECCHTDGTERIVLCSCWGLCQGVEKGRLANVWKADDTDLQVVGRTTKQELFFFDGFLWWHDYELHVNRDVSNGVDRMSTMGVPQVND